MRYGSKRTPAPRGPRCCTECVPLGSSKRNRPNRKRPVFVRVAVGCGRARNAQLQAPTAKAQATHVVPAYSKVINYHNFDFWSFAQAINNRDSAFQDESCREKQAIPASYGL